MSKAYDKMIKAGKNIKDIRSLSTDPAKKELEGRLLDAVEKVKKEGIR